MLLLKRKLIVSLLVVVLGCLVVSPVFGVLSTWYNYDTVSSAWMLTSELDRALGIEVTGTGGVYVSSVWFSLANLTKVPYGNVHVTIMNSLTGNGTRVENSSSFNVNSLVGQEWIGFTFANTTELQSGVMYYIALVSEGLNYQIAVYGSSVFGVTVTKAGLDHIWSESVGSCTLGCMIVVSDTYGSGSGTPPAGPSTTGVGDVDATISSLMWWFIYLVVMIAPAYFLGVFCKMGKWGFLLGLAIGAGVGYGFIAGFPIWLLLAVVVGLVGMIWKDRGM